MPAAPILIASRANPRVKQLRAAFAHGARGNKNTRLSDGLIAIEGEHLLTEALRSGLTLQTVFLSRNRSVPAWLPPSIERIELTEEVFASAVDTQTPQGIAALLTPPSWTLESLWKTVISTEGAKRRSGDTRKSPAISSPLLLVTEALQDPGNLGTLIRSADAFAASAILTLPGTVSPWNQKAIRASAGSIFRMPVIPITLAELTALKSPATKPGAPHLASEMSDPRDQTQTPLHLFAAVADSPSSPRPVPISTADLNQPCALLIGNEGAGLSAELLALANTRITIPTPPRGSSQVESLNAAIAGSILLYEASRQRQTASQRTLEAHP